MVRSGAPKSLRDHCLELSSTQRSNTALNFYDLQGETPHNHLTGETGDISHICELGWY